MKITDIEILVHPDYDVCFALDGEPDQIRLRKRKLWRKKVRDMSWRTSSVLFYFGAFSDMEINEHISFPASLHKGTYELDLNRRVLFGRKLGERFFYFDLNFEAGGSETLGVLEQRGFEYDPQETFLTSFGEWEQLCVYSWLHRVGDTLKIPQENRSINSLLSISIKQASSGAFAY